MALIKRVARLFQSDMHAVLDRIEDPEALLKHSIREMAEDLHRDSLQAKILAREHQQISDQIAKTEQLQIQFDEELDICFESGKDDLARSLIRRKLASKQIFTRLSAQQTTLVKSQAELASRIEENSSLLEAMQQKVELVVSDHQPEHPVSYWNSRDVNMQPVIGDEDVEVAFLREQRKRSKQ
ncbi:MAG: PspA/IM30 family protein [Gammaproteobacteria bacterium]|nr:PspA/IM30 family protein [Gammaproteobacteria bacterium]